MLFTGNWDCLKIFGLGQKFDFDADPELPKKSDENRKKPLGSDRLKSSPPGEVTSPATARSPTFSPTTDTEHEGTSSLLSLSLFPPFFSIRICMGFTLNSPSSDRIWIWTPRVLI